MLNFHLVPFMRRRIDLFFQSMQKRRYALAIRMARLIPASIGRSSLHETFMPRVMEGKNAGCSEI
jgi:hypothetical protein